MTGISPEMRPYVRLTEIASKSESPSIVTRFTQAISPSIIDQTTDRSSIDSNLSSAEGSNATKGGAAKTNLESTLKAVARLALTGTALTVGTIAVVALATGVIGIVAFAGAIAGTLLSPGVGNLIGASVGVLVGIGLVAGLAKRAYDHLSPKTEANPQEVPAEKTPPKSAPLDFTSPGMARAQGFALGANFVARIILYAPSVLVATGYQMAQPKSSLSEHVIDLITLKDLKEANQNVLDATRRVGCAALVCFGRSEKQSTLRALSPLPGEVQSTQHTPAAFSRETFTQAMQGSRSSSAPPRTYTIIPSVVSPHLEDFNNLDRGSSFRESVIDPNFRGSDLDDDSALTSPMNQHTFPSHSSLSSLTNEEVDDDASSVSSDYFDDSSVNEENRDSLYNHDEGFGFNPNNFWNRLSQ